MAFDANQRHLLVEDWVEMVFDDVEGERVSEAFALPPRFSYRVEGWDHAVHFHYEQDCHPEVEEHENLLIHNILRKQTQRVDLLNRSTGTEVEVVALGLRGKKDRRVARECCHVMSDEIFNGRKIFEPEVVEHQRHELHVENLWMGPIGIYCCWRAIKVYQSKKREKLACVVLPCVFVDVILGIVKIFVKFALLVFPTIAFKARRDWKEFFVSLELRNLTRRSRLTNSTQQFLHRATFPVAPQYLRNTKNHRHEQQSRSDPLVVSLINSFFVLLLRSNPKVDQILPHRPIQLLSNDVAAFNPTPRLDLFCVLYVCDVRLALDWFPKKVENPN